MADDVSPERVAAFAAAARVPLTPESAERVARAVTLPVTRFAAAGIVLELEIEPATFISVQRKDAGR